MGIRTQPCWGVGTPAKPSGHEHWTSLPLREHKALGPQAPSLLQGLIHWKLMHTSELGQFSLDLQPRVQIPEEQTWFCGHCWLEIQEIIHMLSVHCSPIRQSLGFLQAYLHWPLWQVEPGQSASDLHSLLSRIQVLESRGLGINPGRH